MHHRVQVKLLKLLGRQSHRGGNLGQRRHSFNIMLSIAIHFVARHGDLSSSTEGIRKRRNAKRGRKQSLKDNRENGLKSHSANFCKSGAPTLYLYNDGFNFFVQPKAV